MTVVAQAAKDTGYGLVVLLGGAIIIGCVYAVYKTLVAGDSPYSFYHQASKDLLRDTGVQAALGPNFKCFAERTRRGRHANVTHAKYLDNQGQECFRISFFAQGDLQMGEVFAEWVKVDGKYGKQSVEE